MLYKLRVLYYFTNFINSLLLLYSVVQPNYQPQEHAIGLLKAKGSHLDQSKIQALTTA